MSCSQPGRRDITRRGRRTRKAVYPLPLYVNAALVGLEIAWTISQRRPLPHLFDIWRAAAPAIDFLSPDLYFPTCGVARQYALPDNPMFIPRRQSGCLEMSANALYAYDS